MLGKRDRSAEVPFSPLKVRAGTPDENGPDNKPMAAVVRPAAAADTAYCPICRDLLVRKCIQCASASGAFSFSACSPCSLAFGACGCVFHGHCLQPWMMRRDTCPVHDSPWQWAPAHWPQASSRHPRDA